MSTYKKFNSQDVYVSTYTAKKNWIVSGSQYSDYGVVNLPGYSGSGAYTVSARNLHKNYDRRLVYESVRHLYYSSFTDGEMLTSSSFENFLQSSYNISGSRDLSDIVSVYSLPRDTYGTAIQPDSFQIKPDSDTEEYVVADYANGVVENVGFLYGSGLAWRSGAGSTRGRRTTPRIPGYQETIVDDGEGNLFLKNKYSDEPNKDKVGNIIYSHGQIILANDSVARYYSNYINGEVKWKSTHPIYTYNFHCKLKEGEFTHTLNPSAISGSNGDIAENVAGEEFSPYITTVGLYNDANELIAIAKTGQPIPIPKDSDMTIVAKIDL